MNGFFHDGNDVDYRIQFTLNDTTYPDELAEIAKAKEAFKNGSLNINFRLNITSGIVATLKPCWLDQKDGGGNISDNLLNFRMASWSGSDIEMVRATNEAS